MEPDVQIAKLRSYAGQVVRVVLKDSSEYVGTFRTELLTERSIAIFLSSADGEGATLYIGDIVEVWPTS